MGTGYTRADTSNNISDGNVINASDFDAEYDAIEAAFATTGHTHDGTAAEGGPITVVGPAQDITVSGSAIVPKTDNTYDLGSSSFEFKDLYIDGVANIDSLVADTADINGGTIDNVTLSASTADINGGTVDGAVIGGSTPAAGTFTTLTATGNVVLGDSAADTVTITADVASNFIPSVDNSYDLGAVGSEWKDLYVDGVAYLDEVDINGNTTTTGRITFKDGANESLILQIGTSFLITGGTGVQYVWGSVGGDISISTNGSGDISLSSADDVIISGDALTVNAPTTLTDLTTSGNVVIAGTQNSTPTLTPRNGLSIVNSGGNGHNFKKTGNAVLEIREVESSSEKTNPIVTIGADNVGFSALNGSTNAIERTFLLYSAGLYFDVAGLTGPMLTSGTGSPEGVVTARVGSIYTRKDGGAGTTLYVKESGTGNTGWVAK